MFSHLQPLDIKYTGDDREAGRRLGCVAAACIQLDRPLYVMCVQRAGGVDWMPAGAWYAT